MKSPSIRHQLIWRFAFSEHPGEVRRNQISAALGQARSVPDPQTDYYWREQGLSVCAFESRCNAPPADLLERCRQQAALISPHWKITALGPDGLFSGFIEAPEPPIIWAYFEFGVRK
jgi:hypothetical protein